MSMILEFDENKDYTVDELENLREAYWNANNKIIDKLTETRIKEYDFTKKFVHSNMYGYMYVTYQNLDKAKYGEDTMFFQGVGINALLGEYSDCSWFTYDAMTEWNIPVEVFLSEIREDDFMEVTKEEFMKVAFENTNKLQDAIEKWVKKAEEE